MAPSQSVPWSSGPTEIRKLENRAINVQQLRNLRLLLQRLCKTGMLQQNGIKISWHAINMYHISDLVVKPIVTFLAEKRGSGHRLSWVEAVSNQEQSAKLMMSHWWGGRFRDFTNVVDNVVRSRGLNVHTTMWICTFANSQFGENFGASIEDTPFCHAINASDGTVLIVDRDAGSLTRIWCALELHFTSRHQKRLEIYTPSGRVGSRLVQSGPLVEAVETWDVKVCEATLPSQRRQILNYMADEARENDGIKQKEDGSLYFVDDWKTELSDTTLTEGPRTRLNGFGKEFKHEAELFESHAHEFASLNEKVRMSVVAAAEACSTGTVSKDACAIENIDERVVTLGELRRFVKKAKILIEKDRTCSYETVRTSDVRKLCMTSYNSEFSFAEQQGVLNLRAQYVIEHQHAANFSETVAGIEWFAEARSLTDSDCLWWDLTALRPGISRQLSAVEDRSKAWKPRLIQDCDGCLFIWASGLNPNRAWFMDALNRCFQSALQVDFASGLGIVACTAPFTDGSWSLGQFESSIARSLVTLDCRECTARYKEDEVFVHNGIQQAPGGFDKLNARIHRFAAGPVVRDAASRGRKGDIDEIQLVCSNHGLLLNNDSMKGSLLETAAHLAAAAGNARALRALLDLDANPNATDHIRETPLHYAAFAGKLSCVKLLLSRGADPNAENAFSETPLVLARNNVAAFLGVDTSKVRKLLEVWAESDQEDDEDVRIGVPQLMSSLSASGSGMVAARHKCSSSNATSICSETNSLSASGSGMVSARHKCSASNVTSICSETNCTW